jgi:hypothetical protein
MPKYLRFTPTSQWVWERRELKSIEYIESQLCCLIDTDTSELKDLKPFHCLHSCQRTTKSSAFSEPAFLAGVFPTDTNFTFVGRGLPAFDDLAFAEDSACPDPEITVPVVEGTGTRITLAKVGFGIVVTQLASGRV